MIQMVGRGLRTVNPEEYPGVVKSDCVILDFGTSSLIHGSLDAIKSGETTMQRQLVIWPSIALSTLLCGLLALTSVLTAVRLISKGRAS